MIGVVLWRDETLTKAVIWCEDQGDLAFYTKDAGAEFQEFNPGDWVEFELTISGNVRIAGNLSVLIEQGSPDLADRLSAEACGRDCGAEDQTRGAVVPFPVQSAKKRSASAPLQASRT